MAEFNPNEPVLNEVIQQEAYSAYMQKFVNDKAVQEYIRNGSGAFNYMLIPGLYDEIRNIEEAYSPATLQNFTNAYFALLDAAAQPQRSVLSEAEIEAQKIARALELEKSQVLAASLGAAVTNNNLALNSGNAAVSLVQPGTIFSAGTGIPTGTGSGQLSNAAAVISIEEQARRAGIPTAEYIKSLGLGEIMSDIWKDPLLNPVKDKAKELIKDELKEQAEANKKYIYLFGALVVVFIIWKLL